MKKNKPIILIVTLLFLLSACGETYTPKPRGYFRIDLPQKDYFEFDSQCPFKFDYPAYALVNPDPDSENRPCWYNVDFPLFHARLHLTYIHIKDDLHQHIELSRSLAYKHTIKADAINEFLTYEPEAGKYGMMYDIQGNAASSVQFYLTDSVEHFMRGALYFFSSPNKDSIAPVVSFIKEDIDYMIESLQWK